jgi:hypothetical protein
VGPILALGAQRVLDRIREKKKRRMDIFLTLMTTRASPLAPNHIQALNSIDVIFKRGWPWRDRQIRDAWHKTLAQMSTDPSQAGWGERVNDLKLDLYTAMGRAVGYRYTIDYLRRQVYLPKHFTDLEQDQLLARQRLLKVVTDDGIKVVVMQESPPKKD